MTVAAYRDRITGHYPIALAEIRSSLNVGFGEEPTADILDMANIDPVLATAPPAYDAGLETVAEGPPASSGAEWFQTWIVSAIPAPSGPIVVSPADLWRRATDAEAEAIDAAMNTQPLRIRRLFLTAQTYQSDDPLWPLLMQAATALFGAERASELLASS